MPPTEEETHYDLLKSPPKSLEEAELVDWGDDGNELIDMELGKEVSGAGQPGGPPDDRFAVLEAL